MITELDKKTALVLIDLQKGIVQLPLAHPVKGVLENAALLVRAFHEAGLPVIIVNVDSSGATWTKTRKEVNRAPASYNDDWTEIVAEIPTEKNDIFITKHTWNAFYETALHEEMQNLKITGIVLAGISVSIGVEGTARAASERGYNITFAKDAMTDTNINAYDNSLQYIFPRIGETGSSAEIIEKLKDLK